MFSGTNCKSNKASILYIEIFHLVRPTSLRSGRSKGKKWDNLRGSLFHWI